MQTAPLSLKDIPLFHDLSERELGAVKSCLREKSFDKGEILFLEGNTCERVFIVRSGRVKLYRMSSAGREQTLETLGPGDTCACNPGSPNWGCASTAEALTAVVVWYFSRDDYLRFVKTNPKMSQTLNRLFAERLQSFSCLIEEVSLKDAKKRLVKFLLDMSANSSRKVAGDGKTLSVSFTREEIAQRIGTARETVARHLSQLKNRKLIGVKPKQILIQDREGLNALLR